MTRMFVIEALACTLMLKFGLEGWKFKYDRCKTICGSCHYNTREIHLSKYYAGDPDVSTSDIVNTILHEIAHALAGYDAGHGTIWKTIAESIGCDAQVCNHTWQGVPAKYVITCPCGSVYATRHRISSRLKGRKCRCCKKEIAIACL